MFAVLAVILFAIALILHLMHVGWSVVLDFILGGALCVAAHLAFAIAAPWARRQ